MSELQPGLNPESTIEDATQLFRALTSLALEHSVWTPWRCDTPQSHRRHRSRNATLERRVPVEYYGIVAPKQHTPEWPGPTYTLNEGLGTVSRKLTLEQRDSATHTRVLPWQRRPPYTPDASRFAIKVTNEEAALLDLSSPRELTEAEEESLKPYGGGVYHEVFNDRGIPEARYEVNWVGEAIWNVRVHEIADSFAPRSGEADPLHGLIVVNALLHEELKPDK